MTTPFEAYKLFLAVKMHFTTKNYDIIKYNGKVNAKIQSFETRKDRFHFAKLARHKDPTGYVVSQFVAGGFSGWVGDLFTEEAGRIYNEYLGRQQSISYNFKSELSRLHDDFLSYFKVKEGQHPPLLVAFKRGAISIETLYILNDFLDFFPIWDRKISDTVLWPGIRDRCLKYKPFLSYDRSKIKSVLREYLV